MRHEIVRFLDIERVTGRVVLGDLLPAVVNSGGIPAFQLQQFFV